jgi:hypothetical protein
MLYSINSFIGSSVNELPLEQFHGQVVHIWPVVVAITYNTVNCNTESEIYHDFT